MWETIMTAWNKDVLHLIFQKFENGHDMLNFSEISRGCNKVFHHNIEIVSKPEDSDFCARKYMKNKAGQYHGIRCALYPDGKFVYQTNYCHNLQHGIRREWFHIIYGRLDIPERRKYHHGTEIEN